MASANFVKKARKKIYQHGMYTEKIHTHGKNIGQSYQFNDRSQPASKDDILLVDIGDAYYWWQFNFSSTVHISKTYPKQSQLTQSDFLSQLYGIQEDMNKADFTFEDFESDKQEFIDQIQQLRDEVEERFDAMPEQLQDTSDAGMTLQERMEALDSWIADLENVEEPDETEIDEEEIKKGVITEMGIEEGIDITDDIQDEDGKTFKEWYDEKYEEKKDEILEEKIGEVGNCECSL